MSWLIGNPLGSEDFLNVTDCGWEKCAPGHSYGPAVRKYYLLHVALSGRGVFENEKGSYPVHAGQGFLIFPNRVTRYEADFEDPWEYYWVGVAGTEADRIFKRLGFSEERPLADVSGYVKEYAETVRAMRLDVETMRDADLAALGGLMRVLSLLAQTAAPTDDAETAQGLYYRKALWYMKSRLQTDLSVREVADFVGLSRSQLYRVFMEAARQSPKQTLTRLRLETARELLAKTNLSLHEVALSAGLVGVKHMGEVFRRETGVSPGALRARERETMCASRE